MNNKELELYRILTIVTECCTTDIDENGTKSITKEDVLGKSRKENVVMTRAMFVSQAIDAGYSLTTIAQLLHRTETAVRHLFKINIDYYKTSRAYRIAHAESTLKCKDILAH